MKKILFFLPMLISSYVSIAQSTNYYNRMNYVFGAIDKNKVTTGLLKEFGVRLNEVEVYNGSTTGTTNWVDKTQWQSLYHSLYSMRVGTATAMDDPSVVFANFNTQQNSNPSTILLAAEYYSYQQYKSDAYTNGDVTVSSDQIYDVTGRNPYETKTAFAVAPMRYYIKGNSASFKLQSNMIYGNTGLSLSSVEVDFGDGLGYQSISLNTSINITYTSGGEKEMKVRFTYTGGIILNSHSKLYVEYYASQPQARFSGPSITPFTITGSAYNGLSALGDITVETAGTDGVLDRPFIIVEGFDPENTFDYFDLINDVDLGGINRIINLQTGLTLNQAIENAGYDLVFVNFQNSTDFIQRNAYMVEEVIQWVNDHKTGTEKNVVMGMSMGGLVARYALRHMETNSRTHQTKLYVSHDAPQQGANAPLALQAFVRHLAGESVSWPVFLSLFDINIVDLKEIAPDLETGLALLESPAAQQMLIYQLQGTGASVSINSNSPHTTFVSEYQSLGYPQQAGIRNIAISNGSECGTSLNFSPYASLVDIDYKVDLPWFTTNIVFTVLNAFSLNPIKAVTSFLSSNTDVKAVFNMRALPNQQAQQIYTGKIFIKKAVLGFINVEEQLIGEKTLSSTTAMLPLDNAGGGIYDISQFATLPAEISQYILQQRFNFVPTYSSLDIGGGTQPILTTDLARIYSPVSPPPSPKNTPFHNFFTNPTTSESHIQFTLNNGNWLLTELQGNVAFYNCASSCSNPPVLQMMGADILCSSETYALANPPVGTIPVWSSSNPSAVSINATTGVASRVGSFNGQVTITATINGGCSNLSVSKTITVGTLQPNFTGPSYDLCDYRSGTRASGTYTVSNVLPGLTYSWEVLDGSTVVMSLSGTSVTIVGIQLGEGSYVLRVKSNSCGTSSSWRQKNLFVVNCGSGSRSSALTFYPNPASEEISIVVQDSTMLTGQYEVSLVDQSQQTRLSTALKGNQLKLKVNHLPEGEYILIIKNKDADIRRQIWIRR